VRLSCPRLYRRNIAEVRRAPTLQGKTLQFGDNFINDLITDLRRFEAGDPPRSCQ
jgi:hypothetical protein